MTVAQTTGKLAFRDAMATVVLVYSKVVCISAPHAPAAWFARCQLCALVVRTYQELSCLLPLDISLLGSFLACVFTSVFPRFISLLWCSFAVYLYCGVPPLYISIVLFPRYISSLWGISLLYLYSGVPALYFFIVVFLRCISLLWCSFPEYLYCSVPSLYIFIVVFPRCIFYCMLFPRCISL